MAQKTCMDDLSVLVITEELGGWMDTTFMPMIKCELELAFSKKPEATKPLAQSFVGIGTKYESGNSIPSARPSARTLEKFYEWEAKEMPWTRRWPLEDVQSLVGLIGCDAPFVGKRGDEVFRNRANMLLAKQHGVPGNLRFIPVAFRPDLAAFLVKFRRGVFSELVRNPRGVHAGLGFCAADARAAEMFSPTGWGFNVGHYYAMEGWSVALRRALVRRTLSISGLENLSALMAVKVWLDRWDEFNMPAHDRDWKDTRPD